MAACAIATKLARREMADNGLLYGENESRPARGAFSLLSEDDVSEMLEMLRAVGLYKFEDSTPVDFFIKPLVLVEQDHIAPSTVECNLVFKHPASKGGDVRLLCRFMVMDPMFVNQNGENLFLSELPKKYCEAVLNSLNPAAYFRALSRADLDALFARAGKWGDSFKGCFATAVKKWQKIEAPRDMATLCIWQKQLLLHEFTHALSLHLPDVFPPGLPQSEQERLSTFSSSAYLKLLGNTQELGTSVVYIKNLFKALQSVEKLEASQATQNTVIRRLALEMFCDRFSMYLFETAQKLKVYRETFPDLEDITVDVMRKMEKQRLQHPAAFMTVNQISDVQGATLAAKLVSTETGHVYISAFGDPAILPNERAIFEPFLDLLRSLDRKKCIGVFTEEQIKGEFFKASEETPP